MSTAAALNSQSAKKLFENALSDTDYFINNKSFIRNHLRQDLEYASLIQAKQRGISLDHFGCTCKP